MLDRLDALLGQQISTRSIGLLRILVGALACLHLRPLLADAVAGRTHHGRFHHPYVDALAEIPAGPYTAIIAIGLTASVAMSVGLAARAATWTTFGVVAFHLLISTTHVHNNRLYLVTVLGLLAMAPCDRSWSVDATIRARRGHAVPAIGPAWTLWLLRFVCATVYGASGTSKLLDRDWFGGTVTWGRVTLQEAQLRSSILPDFAVDLLLDRSFHTVAAKLIVLTELFIAGGLWWRRTRPWAVAVAIVFHVSIELSARVELFSWLAIAVLVVWADPDLTRIGRLRLPGLDRSGATPERAPRRVTA
jgi:vitamin K-dependent gamma-carboxylase